MSSPKRLLVRVRTYLRGLGEMFAFLKAGALAIVSLFSGRLPFPAPPRKPAVGRRDSAAEGDR